MHGGLLPSGGGDQPPGGEGPFFFLSYAHSPQDDQDDTDPDYWIGELYKELCRHVRELAALPQGAPAGFMDRELRQGHEWPDRLAYALATCRVFVPLYSRRYFKSEHCGREWFAFDSRRILQKSKSARPVETIIPALWIPVPNGMLPEAAASVQYNSSSFHELYAQHGFYGIMKVRRWQDVYEEVAYRLAQEIVTAAEASPPVAASTIPYRDLSPAFGGNGSAGPGDKPLRITIVAPGRDELPQGRDDACYGSDFRAWNPYRGESARPLAVHATELARGLSYTPEVGDLYQHEAGLVGGEPPSGPEVLLVDPWATLLPQYRDILQRLDSMNSPWVQVIVVWNQKDDQLRADRDRLRAALDETLSRKLKEGRATHTSAVRGVPSIEEFGLVLPPVIAAAGRHYLRTASARLPREVHDPHPPQALGEAAE